MLERAAGIAFEDLVRRRLFEPVGLASMRFGASGQERSVSGHSSDWFGRPRATPHDAYDYGDPPFGSPAGFLYASVPDLLRYVDFHMQGAHGRTPLLPQTAFDRLHTSPDADRYALGWLSEARRDTRGGVERSIFHSGYSGDFRANLWFVPETGWGTAIVVNDGRGDDELITRDVFYGLLEEFGLAEKDR
jgi:CubicO group peptidase (beta-lactamase class C family)